VILRWRLNIKKLRTSNIRASKLMGHQTCNTAELQDIYPRQRGCLARGNNIIDIKPPEYRLKTFFWDLVHKQNQSLL